MAKLILQCPAKTPNSMKAGQHSSTLKILPRDCYMMLSPDFEFLRLCQHRQPNIKANCGSLRQPCYPKSLKSI